MCGTAIGLITEYHTSGPPIRKIAEQSKTGPGNVIITGIADGMNSTYLPIIFICVAVLIGYQAAGIYGIGLSAVGMLATTGATVTINSYSPIANNAAGITELTVLGPKARKITGGLYYLGDTTAATGKGYATGTAVLTALVLIMAFTQVAELDSIDIKNPFVVIGLFIGAIAPMVCAALTLTAVGNTAFSVVEEIRRQFRETPGLLEGREGVGPDPKRCISVTTSSALKKMTAPGLIVILTPAAVGFLLGKEALGGMLMGSTIMSACMAFFMANSGGAWNNAKKYIEEGYVGGKGSDNHKAIKISDTIGGPFKDTSGPFMNVLIKVMPVVSLILAPLLPTMDIFSRF
jgi:K(+)-stimulated pyrophosphate-energized sodium pump